MRYTQMTNGRPGNNKPYSYLIADVIKFQTVRSATDKHETRKTTLISCAVYLFIRTGFYCVYDWWGLDQRPLVVPARGAVVQIPTPSACFLQTR